MSGRSDAACAFYDSHEHCMKDVSSAIESRYPRFIRSPRLQSCHGLERTCFE